MVKIKTAWEIAKPLLEKDYLSGDATDDMSLQQVIDLRPREYGAVPRRNFGSNWSALKKRIRNHKDQAFEDACYLEHDKLLYVFAKEDPSCWHGSEAQRLLPGDLEAVVVDGNLPDDNKPKKIWLSREEYSTFDLDVFRKHIHQELRKQKETPYWTYKKKQKQLRKAKSNGDNVDEDELDFFDPVLDF